MKKNIGTKDRVIRLVLGIVFLIAVYFVANDVLQILFVAFGAFCIFQATFSWCAWYALLGKSTCPIQSK